jgi:hypothetical protein
MYNKDKQRNEKRASKQAKGNRKKRTKGSSSASMMKAKLIMTVVSQKQPLQLL